MEYGNFLSDASGWIFFNGKDAEMEASSQLMQLLKITSVAGVFLCLILGGVGVILIAAGKGILLVVVWGTLFVGLPLFGLLYVMVKMREYLRDILGSLSTSA